MVTAAAPAVPGLLPWLEAPLAQALRTQRAHALLVYGPPGVGQFEFAVALAQAWLCESSAADRTGGRGCGHCTSCRLVLGRSHPDLRLVVPEALRAEAGLAQDDADDGDDGKKRKPSREIKVDQVRAALHFSELTAGRRGGKVLVLHPAEELNTVAANALLKTLEEPPGAMRFVLSSGAPQALLPTIRSRCQALHLAAPPVEVAERWLAGQGVADARVLLDACGGQPLFALAEAHAGRDAAAWRQLPQQVLAGEFAGLTSWPLPTLVDALGKLCHDRLALSVGTAARFFPAWRPPGAADLAALTRCASELRRMARHADHPWNAGLAVEALVSQVRRALLASPGGSSVGAAARTL
ncbi:MAG: DNA polymerase III subunit delta' [Burkholderiales bacterium]